MYTSIDPGLNYIGFAVWSDAKTLLMAGLSKNPMAHDKKSPRPEVWAAGASALARRIGSIPTVGSDVYAPMGIIIEIPVVRQRGSGKGDPNDLIDVAGVASACVMALKNVQGAVTLWDPKPEEWKGQLPKSVTAARVMEKLSSVEKQSIEDVNAGLLHNVYDAIHMGLVYLKR